MGFAAVKVLVGFLLLLGIVLVFFFPLGTVQAVARQEAREQTLAPQRRFASSLRCIRPDQDNTVGAPLLSNVMVDISSDVPLSLSDGAVDEGDKPAPRKRMVKIHICGEQAEAVAAGLLACKPFWKDFLKPVENEQKPFDGPWSDGVIVPTRLVLHRDSLAPCHFEHNNTADDEGRPRSVVIEDDAWLTVRYGMNNQYHGLFEQGLAQTWAVWRDVSELAARSISSGSKSTDEADSDGRVLLHSYGTGRRRMSFLSVRDMWHRGHFPFHDLWELAMPVQVRLLPQGSSTRLYARRLLLSHYDMDSHIRPGLRGHEGMDPVYSTAVASFGGHIRERLSERFGRVNGSTGLLFDVRPVTGFDITSRARGIEEYLKAELISVLVPEFASSTIVVKFSESVPLARQWELLQAHKLVVGGEGAFFAWLVAAAPGSTWIMVHNHSHSPTDYSRSSNYHAKLVHFFPWVRLIVYVIDSGRREPVAEVARVLRDVPWKGGDVIHIGALPNSQSRYADQPWPSSTPEKHTLAFITKYKKRVVLLSYHSLRPLKVLLNVSAARSQTFLHATSDVKEASAFVLFVFSPRARSSGNETEFILALASDGGLVLSRMADGSVVVCRRELPDSQPLLVKTRDKFPAVVLEEEKSRTFLRAHPNGEVDTALKAAEWETWSIRTTEE
jgi:hypothetical protein